MACLALGCSGGLIATRTDTIAPSKRRSVRRNNGKTHSLTFCRRSSPRIIVPRAKDELSALEEFSEKILTNTIFYLSLGSAFSFAVLRWTEDSSIAVVALAALPIVLLTALSRSSIGDDLLVRAVQNRESMQGEIDLIEEERRESRENLIKFYGATRSLLVKNAPLHLDGHLPGDQGFDPLGLAVAPGSMEKMREYELLHGRWAMLGVPGILLPEFLGRYTDLQLGETVWWKVGASKLSGDDLDYLGVEGLHLAGGQAVFIIVAAQIILMGGPEYARFCGLRSLEPVGVALPGPDPLYPGGSPFDPFNYANNFGSTFYETQRVAEIKHGRLAMVSFFGMAAQALATGQGPVQNLLQTFER